MPSYNASILDVVPDDISKLLARIVKKWWSSYGLPYVTKAFHIQLEVSFFLCATFLMCYHLSLVL
jgi:hypothetical protein